MANTKSAIKTNRRIHRQTLVNKSRRSRYRNAIKKGGTTINNFLSVKGRQGSYQKEFRAYDRESKNCKNNLCLGSIIKINQSNRSTYMCNICQK